MASISEILTASYSTSQEANDDSRDLKSFIGCENNYEVARLALGRSLGLDSHPKPAPDAKGKTIKGLQLFGDEQSCNYLWIGLLGESLRRRGEEAFTLEAFQKLVRDHWHRGIELLKGDRNDSEDDFKTFLDILARRANLPAQSTSSPSAFAMQQVETIKKEVDDKECQDLIKRLKAEGVTAEIRETFSGPRIDRYKLFFPKATERNTLESRIDDVGFALGVGRNALTLIDAKEAFTCFLDVPRPKELWTPVTTQHLIDASIHFNISEQILPVSPGVCINGQPLVFDLAKAPHLLIGGTSGSGKSVCMSGILFSLLTYAKKRPLRFALIDPKQVEFAIWNECPYLFTDVITDISTVANFLEELIEEMETRYRDFADLGVKDLASARTKGYEKDWIVLAIDELADLVMQSKESEERLIVLAQKARAAGIHLILATQRPDAKTFSGILRTNCPSRIALRVLKTQESNIIIGQAGAERLQGAGDMIFCGSDGGSVRAHCYHILTEDITSYFKG
jgi:DNA segregation ATPase FtsK/SpoIIIE, S-DNA-T family